MENKIELIATVKSPSKSSHLRKAKGFSLKEIKEAGRTVNQLTELSIKVDYFRKSVYPENIKQLKSLKILKAKGQKKKAFVKKEKKVTPFKPIKEKPKVVVKKEPIKPVVKEKAKIVKKEKKKPVKPEKVKIEAKGLLLSKLSGLGAATANKFIELGVNDIETLCKEKPEELAPLIKGVSLERLKKWIEEGKELIK